MSDAPSLYGGRGGLFSLRIARVQPRSMVVNLPEGATWRDMVDAVEKELGEPLGNGPHPWFIDNLEGWVSSPGGEADAAD